MNKNTFNIEKWQIDLLHNSIKQGEVSYEVEPKAMEVLVYLAKHAGQTIDKHTLQKVIWPDQEVTNAALSRIIGQLRRCFEDDPKSPNYIMTFKNTGYRLVAEVTPEDFFSSQSEEPEPGSFRAQNLSLAVKLISVTFFLLSLTLLYNYFKPAPAVKIAHKTQYITTDKGEECAPALSPDGKKVVYTKTIYPEKNPIDIVGPLFLKDIKSNQIKQLTHQVGLSYHPTWSPNNRHIAFAHEVLLPNKQVSYKIYSVDTLSSKIEFLTDVSSHTHGLSWSPDGRYLVFPDGPTQNKLTSLVRLNIETKEKQKIISPVDPNDDYGYPNYSPDGKSIAIIRTDQGAYDSIDLIDTKTFTSKTIFKDQQKIPSLTWKDDNTLFVVSGGVASSQLLELSILNNKTKTIDIDHNYIEYLSYSQSTKKLIFESLQTSFNIFYTKYSKYSNDNNFAILDTDELTHSNQQDLEAVESPDGHYLALTSTRSRAFEIWLKNNKNKQIQKFTDIKARNISGLDWSPKSDKLAFVATVNNETALYWLSITDKQLNKFSHGNNNYSLIGWGQQNTSIWFSSNANGQWKLWRLYTDENDIELVSDAPIMHGRLSPNRDMIYFVKHKQLGIWRSNLTGLNSTLVPGTKSIITSNPSWTVAENGLYYLKISGAGEREGLYFQSFGKDTPTLVSTIGHIYLNRIYWSKQRLFYSAYQGRNSDIGMVQGL